MRATHDIDKNRALSLCKAYRGPSPIPFEELVEVTEVSFQVAEAARG
jgi:hypothetical protein